MYIGRGGRGFLKFIMKKARETIILFFYKVSRENCLLLKKDPANVGGVFFLSKASTRGKLKVVNDCTVKIQKSKN